MKYNAVIAIPFISVLLCAMGCDKAVGPAGPKLSGNLIGFCFLWDINGKKATDDSGVTVRAEGTNIFSTTGSNGYWELDGLTTGTYTYSFSKAGYGTRKSIDAQFVGGGDVYYGTANLYEIPSFTITNLSDSISVTTGNVYLNGVLSGNIPNIATVRIFVGTSPSVSSDPSSYVGTDAVGGSVGYLFPLILTENDFNYYGFSSGQAVYVVAYADGYASTAYIDLSTGNYIYTGINPTPSNVISFVLP